MSEQRITARGVTKSFGQGAARRVVLHGINAQFEHGKTYAISGVSGTGKSTLMHLLAGLDLPSEGEIFFNGHSLAALSTAQRSAFLSTTVGLVFQSPYLISELSVQENVMLPALIAGRNRARAEKKVATLLKKVGLDDRALDAPSSLSGGQQQRVAVARALVNEPAFLLADEPTGNLDVKTGKQIVDLLLECQREWGMGIIVTSHDAYVAKSMQTVLKLHDGSLYTV